MSGIGRTRAVRTSSTSSSNICGTRSTARSGRIRSKRSAGQDTDCVPNRTDRRVRPPGRWPIKLRLTLAFGVAMAVILAAAGTFLYLRLASELHASTDASLRAQADVLVSGIG